MYTTFRQTFVYILYIKSKELCQLNFVYKIYTNVCLNLEHFVYKHFAYILYTKCVQKFVEMWDTFCMQTFCINFVYTSFDLQKVYIINIMHTVCI